MSMVESAAVMCRWPRQATSFWFHVGTLQFRAPDRLYAALVEMASL